MIGAETLGERVRLLRTRQGTTTRAFCEATQMNQSDLWRIETGKTSNPHWLRVVRIGEVLGVSLDELAGRGEDE